MTRIVLPSSNVCWPILWKFSSGWHHVRLKKKNRHKIRKQSRIMSRKLEHSLKASYLGLVLWPSNRHWPRDFARLRALWNSWPCLASRFVPSFQRGITTDKIDFWHNTSKKLQNTTLRHISNSTRTSFVKKITTGKTGKRDDKRIRRNVSHAQTFLWLLDTF